MKLCFQNNSNLSTALLEYRRLKGLRKGNTLRQALKKMITKFEETEDLDLLLGRGRKRLSDETEKEVVLAVVERAADYQYSSICARAVSRDLFLPCLQYGMFFNQL
ncbi:hypothetical protein AVEN_98315-1 [Araneus ventricosus]|uniref:DUF4817 domain-containing protein n=1 Tax=Araneus ventricosus TaxID=182803 RepID=A0A4Y2VIE5_ARAVE|nr:hypothetical protein AVEN_84306-1 [Araneus ventricosus]GBO24264.1 hypothetical protein AVEN_98315-1 [Araneus ventricosus]